MTKTKKINDLIDFAKLKNVPIISIEGLNFLLELIKENNVINVLEIGTAIGYSSINMALLGCYVDTFERNENMIIEARKNILEFDLVDKINLFAEDALLFNGELKKYDLIFIDAAKAQYEKFFLKYSEYLNDSGVIVCDNLNFHNLDKDNVNRNTRQLMNKIEKFKHFLSDNKEYTTSFKSIGDGMSVSKKVI